MSLRFAESVRIHEYAYSYESCRFKTIEAGVLLAKDRAPKTPVLKVTKGPNVTVKESK